MSIQVGRLNIPMLLLSLGFSLLITLAVMVFKKYNKRERDFIFNSFFIFFVAWKLSPIFTNFKSFLHNPIATLYLPGGVLGYIFAGICSGIYIFYKVKKEKVKTIPIVIFALLGITSHFILPLFIKSEIEEIKLSDYSLVDIDGKVVTIPEDDIVILNFWATWCPPCKAEKPELNSFYQDNQNLTFYGINLLNTETSKRDVLDFIDEVGIQFPVVFEDEKSLSNYFDIKTIPTTVILIKDENGYMINKHSGAITQEILNSMIKK